MTESAENTRLMVVIPISGSKELRQYQQAVINLLSRIEVNDCNSELREDIKSLYKLLAHLRSSSVNKIEIGPPE